MLKITQSLVEAGVFSRIAILAAWEEGLDEFQAIDEQRSVHRIRTTFGGRESGKFGKFIWVVEWLVRTTLATFKCRPNCVNCHSLLVLPIGVFAKGLSGCKLVYDTHELETETGKCVGFRRRLLKLLERLCIPFVDETIVVGPEIAKWYQAKYSLPIVHVARNVPHRAELEKLRALGRLAKSSSPLRTNLGIANDDLVFLYQGLLDEGRGVKLMLDAFTRCDKSKHLVLMGYGGLESSILEFSKRFSNIHYHQAVPQSVLPTYTVGADVGLALIENICLSYYYCLPNKLFEYLTCGLPVVVSDFPEMSSVVERFQCGWRTAVSATGIHGVLTQIDHKQVSSRKATALRAGKAFCWEDEATRMLAAYGEFTVQSSASREAA